MEAVAAELDEDEDDEDAADWLLSEPADPTTVGMGAGEEGTRLFLVGELIPGLAKIGGACNCCTSELGLEVLVRKPPDVTEPLPPTVVTDPPDMPLEGVPLRPLNLSSTVLRLFLLTEVIPLGLDTGTGFSKLAVGLGAILGMVPAI